MVIFWSGPLLVVYSLVIFFCISYTVISFYGYGLDRRRLHVLQEVDQSQLEEGAAEEGDGGRQSEGRELSEQDLKRIGIAVEKWLAAGGHLHSGITIQTAAQEVGVPRYQLSAWLKTTPQELFKPWLMSLRVEEAKRQLVAHPDWTNDTIAERCGFNTRNYFQTIFKKHTGMRPAEYLAALER